MSKSALHREAFGGEQLVKIVDGLLGLLLAAMQSFTLLTGE